MNEFVAAVDLQVRLPPEGSLPALGSLVHLRVAPVFLVLRRTRHAEDRGIDKSVVADLDPLAGQVGIHGREQPLAELSPLQQMAELADRGLIRCPFLPQVNPCKDPHRGHVVQGFFHHRDREVEPQLQEVHSQHPLQRNRRLAAGLTHLRIVRLDHRYPLAPRHDSVSLREKAPAPCHLPLPLKPGQRLLFH